MIKAALSFFLDFFPKPLLQWQQLLNSVASPNVKQAFNRHLPSVKKQQRKASKVAARRRARKLGHA